nr:long-chain-fatty-acid--CoA ligase [Pseudorhizobium flavum]
MVVRERVAHWHPDDAGVELQEITVGQALRTRAATMPHALALVFDDPAGRGRMAWTYAELDEGVDRLARGLIAWGVIRGDHVAVMAGNSPEWVLLEYALARIGAVLVTVNTALKRDEIGYILSQGQVSTLFFSRWQRGYDVGAAISTLTPDLTLLTRICGLEDDDAPATMGWKALLDGGGSISDDALAEVSDQVCPSDIAQIQFTSGTTGSPKGAMLRHRSIVNNARLMAARAGFVPEDRLLSAMPLFHTAGCVCNVLGMLMAGGCLILMPSFDARDMVALVEREGATIINAVPTMYLRMLEELDAMGSGQPALSSLRIAFTGGTSIPPELMRRLKMRFGAEPMIIMGMTEASPIITQTNPADDFERKITTAGIPLPHTELRIGEPGTGTTLACGQVGELLIRGYQITAGYFDMPDATEKAISPDGWLSSGDLAVLDEDGHLTIVGRIKDMLIRGGENIFPVEIEKFLQTHPDVTDAYVVGVPDPDLGEEIFAFVRLRDGARVGEHELKQFCRANLSRQKMPRYVRVIETLPMTANGKVQKFALRELAARLMTEETEKA